MKETKRKKKRETMRKTKMRDKQKMVKTKRETKRETKMRDKDERQR